MRVVETILSALLFGLAMFGFGAFKTRSKLKRDEAERKRRIKEEMDALSEIVKVESDEGLVDIITRGRVRG